MTVGQRAFRILAERAWRTENPYNYLLSKALTENGCSVGEMTRHARLFDCADVVHIHWPQPGSRESLLRALFRSLERVLELTIQKMRGAVIVWTIHNIRGHDQKHRLLEAAVISAVVRLIDGAIFLGEDSCDEAFRAMPVLAKKPHTIIPHGMYEVPEGTPPSSREARSMYGFDQDGAVIGFFGDIKPYKGLDTLLDAFAEILPGQATLFVAGVFRASKDYARELRSRIASLVEKGHRIAFLERRLGDKELAAAIKASDVVVLPYRESVNSGFALFVLGLGGRIVTSGAPGFRSLEAELGNYWVRPARDGSLHVAIGEALSRNPTPHDDARMAAFRNVRSWPSIARLTIGFYSRLRDGHRTPLTTLSVLKRKLVRPRAVDRQEYQSNLPYPTVELEFWQPPNRSVNFGDFLSRPVVSLMLARHGLTLDDETLQRRQLLAIGSILHLARDGSVVWGSGVNGKISSDRYRFRNLDVRAVRGPLTRDFLNKRGIAVPDIFGDPALLLPSLMPGRFSPTRAEGTAFVPNLNDLPMLDSLSLNGIPTILPTQGWNSCVESILRRSLVLSSSLHGIIIAEAYGIPARYVRVSAQESLFKYQDYYAGTGREQFHYARSIAEGLEMGGERTPIFDATRLIDAFPLDLWR
jgi:pyruvyltransferase